jgi:glycosyltransferase involved in cell wall biosynthesis
MKIAYLGAGAGGRICGACFHDNGLATAMQARGQDLVLIPTYTPIRTDEENVSLPRIFFGGVNVYLQQKSALFRHTPWFLDKLFDSPRLLNWLTTRSSNMHASELGELTVSTLQGRDGRQAKEIRKLIAWLRDDFRPDVVHLSNVMLAGLAGPLKESLHVPLACGLMGEDIFIEDLPEPYYSQARALLKEKAADIDRFTALNHYYADLMSDYLQVTRDKIQVIRHGLNLQGHDVVTKPATPELFTIGFFARIAVEKGLHNLIEAVAILRTLPDLPPFQVQVAGYKSAADEPYLERCLNRVQELQLQDRFTYLGELDRQQKLDFLSRVDVMAVPTVYHESKGISVLEAMASGIPVIVPAHGAFPEYIADTGGGLLCVPDDPTDLAHRLAELLRDPAHARSHGQAGAAAIRAKYSAAQMAAEHERFYTLLQRSSFV